MIQIRRRQQKSPRKGGFNAYACIGEMVCVIYDVSGSWTYLTFLIYPCQRSYLAITCTLDTYPCIDSQIAALMAASIHGLNPQHISDKRLRRRVNLRLVVTGEALVWAGLRLFHTSALLALRFLRELNSVISFNYRGKGAFRPQILDKVSSIGEPHDMQLR